MLFLCACKCLFILLCWFLLITNLPVQSLYIKYSFVLYRVSIHLRWVTQMKQNNLCSMCYRKLQLQDKNTTEKRKKYHKKLGLQ